MKIGILGGGQLGRMLIQEALKYDDEFFVLDPSEQCPCSSIAHLTVGDFNEYDAVFNFGRDKEVLTIEIEHINVDALFDLEKEDVKIIPSPSIIKTIQQKILQKEFYTSHSIPTPSYQTIQNKSEINFPFPYVQKLNTGGYDGKGVQVIRNEKDEENLWNEPSVIESLVDIDKELSVIVAKNEEGQISVFPVTEMVADPELNLLDFNISPCELTPEVHKQIATVARQFIEAADSVGLFAIELFLDREGKIWVNETAPRLHNSGHLSQEGNYNSQFEQFYRVLKNKPLANVDSRGFSGMINLVGADGYSGNVDYEGLDKVLKLPKTYVHLYGKELTKPGRKMGHINVLANSKKELLKNLVHIKSLVKVKSK